MKENVRVLAMVVLFIFASMVRAFADDIIWDDIGRGNLGLKTVLINPNNPQIIYVGSSNAVLKSEDNGKNWRNILSVKGQDKAVNFLLFDPNNKNSLYAGTGNGLFYSITQGRSWCRIFQGKNYLENKCTTLATLPYGIYLGTKGGLFISKDNGRSWHKETGKIGKSYILAIAYDLREPGHIYVACIDGVFRTKDNGKSWERIFINHPVESDSNGEEAAEDQDEEERSSDIRYISIDPNNSNYLYLATLRGVYKSQNKGESWELLSTYGLFNQDIKFLLVSRKSNIYAVAKSGVFEYRDQRWHELSSCLVATEINFLSLDAQENNLYAACNKGLFKAHLAHSHDKGKEDIMSLYYKDEPRINEIQEAAINYAEVASEKIKRWRKQAAKKAILPKVSVGLDRNSNDLWHWETGSTTRNDDDALRKGRDSLDWCVSLSWDLSGLIWNEDQTSIDVRSRLMVQLRDDIVDEVTKLYFERIRVKMELENLSIEDRKMRFEKQLKIQELTASLDGLTGGYFSSRVPN